MIHEVPKNSHASVVESICEYHKKHPEHRNYAGCMCGAKYSLHNGKKEDCAECKTEGQNG